MLIRNAEALEILEKVDTLVIDKTGTLTEGKPKLVSVSPDDSEVLRLAASVERLSEHPLAAAIVAGATERGLPLGEARDFLATPGTGVSAVVEGHQVAIGNACSAGAGERAGELTRDGQTVVYVTIDGQPAGLLGIADPIKPSAEQAIERLRRDGIRDRHAHRR